jgi:hypothetical protein
MPQVIFDIANINRVTDAFCGTYNRPADSPLTPKEFTKKAIINYIKNVTANYESRAAQQQAAQAAIDDVNTNLTIS